MKLGESLKYCRNVRKLTQKELAEKSGISKSYLCLLEKGEREASISVLESLSDALKIPVAIIVLIASEGADLSDDVSKRNIDKLNKLVKVLLVRVSE